MGPQKECAPAQGARQHLDHAGAMVFDEMQGPQHLALREHPQRAADRHERGHDDQGKVHRDQHPAAEDLSDASVARERRGDAHAQTDEPRPGDEAVEIRPASGEGAGLPASRAEHPAEQEGRDDELHREHDPLERKHLDHEQPQDVEQHEQSERVADTPETRVEQAREQDERRPHRHDVHDEQGGRGHGVVEARCHDHAHEQRGGKRVPDDLASRIALALVSHPRGRARAETQESEQQQDEKHAVCRELLDAPRAKERDHPRHVKAGPFHRSGRILEVSQIPHGFRDRKVALAAVSQEVRAFALGVAEHRVRELLHFGKRGVERNDHCFRSREGELGLPSFLDDACGLLPNLRTCVRFFGKLVSASPKREKLVGALAAGRHCCARLLDLELPFGNLLPVFDESKADVPDPGGPSRATDPLHRSRNARSELGASCRNFVLERLELGRDRRPCGDPLEIAYGGLRAVHERGARPERVFGTWRGLTGCDGPGGFRFGWLRCLLRRSGAARIGAGGLPLVASRGEEQARPKHAGQRETMG